MHGHFFTKYIVMDIHNKFLDYPSMHSWLPNILTKKSVQNVLEKKNNIMRVIWNYIIIVM